MGLDYNIKDITLEMFPENFRDFLETLQYVLASEDATEEETQELSMMIAMNLCEIAGGEQLYVPKLDAVLRPLVHDEIVQAWLKGAKFDALARKHNLSTDSIRRICRENYAKNSKSITDFIDELPKQEASNG